MVLPCFTNLYQFPMAYWSKHCLRRYVNPEITAQSHFLRRYDWIHRYQTSGRPINYPVFRRELRSYRGIHMESELELLGVSQPLDWFKAWVTDRIFPWTNDSTRPNRGRRFWGLRMISRNWKRLKTTRRTRGTCCGGSRFFAAQTGRKLLVLGRKLSNLPVIFVIHCYGSLVWRVYV